MFTCSQQLQSSAHPAGQVISISLQQEALFFFPSFSAGPPPITPQDQPHGTLSLCFLLPPQGLCFGKGGESQVQSGEEGRWVT